MDWLSYTMNPLNYPLRITYFSLASNKSISTVSVEKEYRSRVCRGCNTSFNVYSGICDYQG